MPKVFYLRRDGKLLCGQEVETPLERLSTSPKMSKRTPEALLLSGNVHLHGDELVKIERPFTGRLFLGVANPKILVDLGESRELCEQRLHLLIQPLNPALDDLPNNHLNHLEPPEMNWPII